MFARTLALVVALGIAPAQAKIYKWVMPDGTTTYSDRPQEEGATQVELPRLQTYTPPPAPASGAASAPAKAPAAQGYERFAIASPAPDETVRDNAGNVSVQIDIKPPLRPGHTVEIFLDGKSLGSGAATSASITDVDRGSHTVTAAVRDADGTEIQRAAGVTFHLKQASRLSRPRPTPLPSGGSGAPAAGAGGAAAGS